MTTFERLKMWLATSLENSEEIITPQSTLGELMPSARKTGSVGLEWAFVLEFEREFSDTNGEFLTQNTTVQQIVDLIDKSTRRQRGTSASRVARPSDGDQRTPAQTPAVRVFEYIPELDAFLITKEFERLARYLGLREW